SLCLASSSSNSLSSGARSASVFLPSCSLSFILVTRAFRSSWTELLSAASARGIDPSNNNAIAAATILNFIRSLDFCLGSIKSAKHRRSLLACQTHHGEASCSAAIPGCRGADILVGTLSFRKHQCRLESLRYGSQERLRYTCSSN